MFSLTCIGTKQIAFFTCPVDTDQIQKYFNFSLDRFRSLWTELELQNPHNIWACRQSFSDPFRSDPYQWKIVLNRCTS